MVYYYQSTEICCLCLRQSAVNMTRLTKTYSQCLEQSALLNKKLYFLTSDNGTESRFLCVPFRKAKGFG